MLLEARKGQKGRVVDLDSGREVPKVKWLNTDQGVLEAYQLDEKGRYIRDEDGEYVTYVARGRFAFVPRGAPSHQPDLGLGASRCARCPSVLTLPGDDLCPTCRARERGQRHSMRVERLVNPLLDIKCLSCSRLAEFIVADEVLVSPTVSVADRLGRLTGRKVTWERGMTVGRRAYCSWCFKAPRLLDAKGEVIGDVETRLRPG
jgi:hypothetical protein